MYNRDKLIVQTAILYYEDEMSQTAIAKKLDISRPTVASFLKEAKDRGIVQISIQYDELNVLRAQEKITDYYGLKSVSIASSSSTDDAMSMVGKLSVKFLESRLDDIQSLGIGMGRTLYEFVKNANYRPVENLEIVPLIGGVGLSEINLHSNHLAFSLAQKYDCKVNYFYAPAVTDTPELKNSIEQSLFIQEVYDKGKQVDYAVVSVGTTFEYFAFSETDNYQNMFKPSEADSQAVGNLLGTFFDRNGNIVNTSITNRTVALELEEFKNIPNKVIAAAGIDKGPAVVAALKLGLINHLIIDSDIAEYLMNEIDDGVPTLY